MKTLIFLLVLIPELVLAQCWSNDSGTFKVIVYDDSVVFINDTTCRNCGALYTSVIRKTAPDTLEWLQIDTGTTTYCFCYFNISATLDSLSSGNYYTKTYRAYIDNNDTIKTLIGNFNFTITQLNTYSSFHNKRGAQSSCFDVGIPNILNPTNSFIIQPNPSIGVIELETNLEGEKTVIITDLHNKIVLKTTFEHYYEIFNISNYPSGCYILYLETNKNYFHKKIIKM